MTSKKHAISVSMTPTLFAGIAFHEDIEAAVVIANRKCYDKKGRNLSMDEKSNVRSNEIEKLVGKLTTRTVNSAQNVVCKYLNMVGSYILPVRHIEVDLLTA